MADRKLQLILSVVNNASAELRKVQSELQSVGNVPIGNAAKSLSGIGKAASEASQSVTGIGGAAGGVLAAVSSIGAAFFGVQAAIQAVTASAKGFFDSTVGAAEKLNSQILSSQTNLANAVTIKVDGKSIDDAFGKIQATKGFITDLTKEIELQSVDLVGVTSEQVVGVTDVLLRNTPAIVGQFDATKRDLKGALTSLTKGFASELKLSGLDLSQANQEISSILRGDVGADSLVAKKLGLTGPDIAKLKGQGKLVEELLKRLEVSVAGNKILSGESLSGQLTNVLDVFQIIGREAGKPLLVPLVKSVEAVFKILNDNKDTFIAFAQGASQSVANAANQIGASIQGVLPTILQKVQQTFGTLSANLSTFAQNVLPGLTQAFQTIAPAIGGTFQVVASVVQNLITTVSTLIAPLGQIIGATFGAIAKIVEPGVAAFLSLTKAFSGIIDASTELSTSPGIQFLIGGLASGLSIVISTIGDVGASITSVLGGAIEFIAPVIGDVIKGLLGVAEGVGNTIKFFEPLLRLVGALGAGLAALIQGQTIAYFKQLGSIVQVTVGLVGKLATVIGAALKPAFDLVGGAITNVSKALNDTISNVGKFQTEIVSKVVSTVEGLINNPAFQVVAKTLGIDSAAIQAGLNALKSNVTSVTEKVAETGKEGGKIGEKIAEGGKKAGEGLEFGVIQAEKLGTSYQQLETQLANTQRIIAQNAKGPELKKALDDRIKLLQQAQELGTISPEKAQEELAKIAANSSAELATQQAAQDGITKARKLALDQQKQEFQKQQSDIQELLNNGTISEAEAAKRTTAVRSEELAKQLEATTKAIKAEQAAIAKGTGSKSRLKELQTQQQTQEAEVSKLNKEARDKENQLQLQNFDEQQKILEGRKAQGLVGEQQFAAESLKITQARLDKEQQLLTQKRSKLDPKDKEGLEAIAAQEAEIQVKRTAAIEQFEARRLAILERAQAAALDAVKIAETQRNTEVDRLVAARQIRESEAGLLRVQNSKDTIAQELALEKQKIAQLEALPKSNDEGKEEQRQAKIRASRQKSADLVGRLVKNEIEQQQALFRVVSERLDRQAQRAKIAADNEIRPLQNQLKLQEALTASLDNQNKLFGARRGLQEALNGFAQTGLSLLSQGAKTDEEREKIVLLTAASRLKALQQQQEFERQSLENEIQRNQLALENEKIQNRIAQIQNQASVARAQADLAKAKADPNATPEGVAAAQQAVEAERAAGLGLQLQGLLLEQKKQTQDTAAEFDRARLNVTQQGQTNQARGELIGALPKEQQEAAQNKFQKEILRGLGLGSTSIAGINTQQIRQAATQGGNFNLPGGLNPTAAQLPQVTINPQIEAIKQQLSQMTTQTTTAATQQQQATSSADSKAILAELQRISGAAIRPIESSITQNINGPDTATVIKQVRRETDAGLAKTFASIK
ncbi:hypothetical protein H6F86_20680 [Phormidium sp. FACHB-592]|uniref:Uncharacterized protein n=1 Tax=Stenomitos frigidus AS-A4 TaxID=2933935 RepID=A0ABV0KEJ7_9CYAN|nr:hypothetical protein [Phormidium sp. FACHB-592]MBD2076249.1 hypothetical protein [Phormidium sp. FACHB-592]